MVSPQALQELFCATQKWLAEAEEVQRQERQAMQTLAPEALEEALQARWRLLGALEELSAQWQNLRKALAPFASVEAWLRAQGEESLLAAHRALLARVSELAMRESAQLARVDAYRRVGEALLAAANMDAHTYGPSGRGA